MRDYRAKATEIMFAVNDEKWYETRARIEDALAEAGTNGWLAHAKSVQHLMSWTGPTLDQWRDQPDGVR